MRVEDLLIAPKTRTTQSNKHWIAIDGNKYPDAFKTVSELKGKIQPSGVSYFVVLCLRNITRILPILEAYNNEKAKK